MTRRSVVQAAGAMALGSVALRSASAAESAVSSSPAAGGRLRKAIGFGMLPDSLSIADRFKLAADVGFQGIEAGTVDDDATVEAMRSGADRAGIRIHSVMNAGNWDHPLTSPDAAIAKKGLEIVRRSIRNAHAFGADAVLLVSAVVTPQVRYQDAWPRSQAAVREVIPLAEELKVTLAIENVGNRFLLSPLEFARYVDEFNSPFVRAYFDIGNTLVLWAYPQDWIRTLGRRICRLHLKDYDQEKKRWAPVGEGNVDWPAVCEALREVDYRGFVTAEVRGGDQAYLRDLSKRMDKVFSTLS